MAKGNKKIFLGIAMMVIGIVVLMNVYSNFKEKAVEGSKQITIEVVNSKEESIVYEVATDAQYLEQAMDEAEGLTYVSEEGPYGATVVSVNGEEAKFEDGVAYWGFLVNGEFCNYGISEQPVEDGDAFQIMYTKQ